MTFFQAKCRMLEAPLHQMVREAQRAHHDADDPTAAFVWLTHNLDCPPDVAMDYFLIKGTLACSPRPTGEVSVPADRPILCVPLDGLFGPLAIFRSAVIERIARDLLTLNAVTLGPSRDSLLRVEDIR